MRFLSLLLALALLAPPAARAQESPDESARRHFENGVKLYNDGDFDRAVREFEASYHDRAVPTVLFNLSLARKGQHDYATAKEVMEKFLREGGDAITPEQRKEAVDLLTEWRSLLAELTVLASPESAVITVDGDPMASTSKKLNPGTHVIEITATGYLPERQQIDVAAGTSPRIEVTLKRAPTNGHLRITCEPSEYATILIDDVERGGLPFDEDLPAGAHNIEVRAAGFQPHKDAVALSVGERRSMHFSLDAEAAPESNWYKKWYFWTGLILVVGGGAVAAAYFTTRVPDAYVGTLGPGVFTVGR